MDSADAELELVAPPAHGALAPETDDVEMEDAAFSFDQVVAAAVEQDIASLEARSRQEVLQFCNNKARTTVERVAQVFNAASSLRRMQQACGLVY